MAKQSGLGQNFYVDGHNLSGDVGSVGTWNVSRGTVEDTGIDKSAVERLLTHGDFEGDFTAYLNDATDQEHEALKGLPTADVNVTWASGTSREDAACMVVAKQLNYDGTRGQDGSLTFTVNLNGNGVLVEWGKMLTAGVFTYPSPNQTTTGVIESQTTAGLAAMYHAVSADTLNASNTAQVRIEDSSDTTNGTDGTWATLLNFTKFSSVPTSARSTASGTVEKGLRTKMLGPDGTFSNVAAAVSYRRGTANDDNAY